VGSFSGAYAHSRLKATERVTGSMLERLAEVALADVTGIRKENLFEASTVRIELNGYPAEHPEKKIANEIALTALASDCERALLGTVRSALAKLSTSGADLPFFDTSIVSWIQDSHAEATW